MAQARLQRRSVDPLPRRAVARPLRTLCPTDDCGMESGPMNEFGEPNMGNPSVRFDEGRERVGHWPLAFQSTAPAYSTEQRVRFFHGFTTEDNHLLRVKIGQCFRKAHAQNCRSSEGY